MPFGNQPPAIDVRRDGIGSEKASRLDATRIRTGNVTRRPRLRPEGGSAREGR
jgi:hypothetical protein